MEDKNEKNKGSVGSEGEVNEPGLTDDAAGDNIVKTFVIGASTSSKQLQFDRPKFEGVEVAHPPNDPIYWAALMEFSTRLVKCINTYAMNTVAYGWQITPTVEITPETTDEIRARIRLQVKMVEELFNRPNEEMPFTELMKMMKIDEESTGNGYIEVVRDPSLKIVKLYHAPAATTRVLKSDNGYAQVRGGKTRYFKKFGDHRRVDMNTGKEASGDIPWDQLATEIIHFRIYSPSSPIYGIPRYTSCAPNIVGSRMAHVRNMNFFKNDAVPRMIVSVSGGELDAESVKSIKEFTKADAKGPSNAGRVMILQTGKKKITSGNTGPKIDVTPLTVGAKEDASFLAYLAYNDEQLRESFGIGKIFLGTTDNISKGNAIESRRVTNDQEFKPDKRNKEYRINHTVVRDLVGFQTTISYEKAVEKYINSNEELNKDFGVLSPLEKQGLLKSAIEDSGMAFIKQDGDEITLETKPIVQLVFEQPHTSDPLETAKVDQIYGNLAAITINELRAKLNLEKIDAVWADLPYALLLHSRGVAEGQDLLGQTDDEEGKEEDGEVSDLPDSFFARMSPMHRAVALGELFDIRSRLLKGIYDMTPNLNQ